MTSNDDTTGTQTPRDTEHDMKAEAFVPLDAEITKYGLEATQQLDLDIRRWVCSCGESWEDRQDAEDHLTSVRDDDTT